MSVIRPPTLVLLLIALSLTLRATADDVPPLNVVIIFADDLGSLDTHAYGAEDLVTPHPQARLDKISPGTRIEAKGTIERIREQVCNVE